MSAVTRPRGPLPPRVYWTRRLVLLAIVLVLAWLVVRWIDGGDSGAASSGGEQPVAATASDDGDSLGSESSGRRPLDKDRSDRTRTVVKSFERPDEVCDLTRVLVAPTITDPVYAGEPVAISLRIWTTSSTACTLSIDSDHLLLSITSTDDTVWDSTHCEDAIPTRDIALQPGWSTPVDVTWSGQYSGRRCPSNGTAADPGTYTIETAVLEGEPTAIDFELVERPDPVDDDTDSPSDDHQPTDTAPTDGQPTDTAPTDGQT